MTDFHATQLTGSRCQGRNCAAASGAMAVAFGTRYAKKMSADAFRAATGASCVPGVHSASGGLFVSDVIKGCAEFGVPINYGLNANDVPKQWSEDELRSRLRDQGEGLVCIGRYGALPAKYRVGTFTGMHSTWVHAYRSSDHTVGWHDPLRKGAIRLPFGALLDYWEGGSPARYAGFVAKLPLEHVDSNGAPLRAKPHPHATRIERLPAGAALAVTHRAADWHHVWHIATGRLGWIRETQLR